MDNGGRTGSGINWEVTAARLFCLLVLFAAVYFAGKYVVGFALPFIFAWAIASAAVPVADRISAKLGISRRVCAAVTVLLMLAVIFVLATLAVNRAAYELERLIARLGDEHSDAIGDMISAATGSLDSISSHIPLLKKLRESGELAGFFDGLDSALGQAVGELISRMTAAVPALAASVIKALPSILLSFAVAVISSFYFALDRDRITGFIASAVPKKWRHSLPELRRRAGKTAAGYVKAYLLILLITFCELFVGFSILGIDYAFLIAAAVAVIDILPVLGVGTVLIPWVAIEFVSGNIRLGVGLLILFAVIEIVRQFIEPRIVGGTLGIHPLVTLAAMYIGFALFGVGGMFIGPIIALAARAAVAAYRTASLRTSSS